MLLWFAFGVVRAQPPPPLCTLRNNARGPPGPGVLNEVPSSVYYLNRIAGGLTHTFLYRTDQYCRVIDVAGALQPVPAGQPAAFGAVFNDIRTVCSGMLANSIAAPNIPILQPGMPAVCGKAATRAAAGGVGAVAAPTVEHGHVVGQAIGGSNTDPLQMFPQHVASNSRGSRWANTELALRTIAQNPACQGPANLRIAIHFDFDDPAPPVVPSSLIPRRGMYRVAMSAACDAALAAGANPPTVAAFLLSARVPPVPGGLFTTLVQQFQAIVPVAAGAPAVPFGAQHPLFPFPGAWGVGPLVGTHGVLAPPAWPPGAAAPLFVLPGGGAGGWSFFSTEWTNEPDRLFRPPPPAALPPNMWRFTPAVARHRVSTMDTIKLRLILTRSPPDQTTLFSDNCLSTVISDTFRTDTKIVDLMNDIGSMPTSNDQPDCRVAGRHASSSTTGSLAWSALWWTDDEGDYLDGTETIAELLEAQQAVADPSSSSSSSSSPIPAFELRINFFNWVNMRPLQFGSNVVVWHELERLGTFEQLPIPKDFTTGADYLALGSFDNAELQLSPNICELLISALKTNRPAGNLLCKSVGYPLPLLWDTPDPATWNALQETGQILLAMNMELNDFQQRLSAWQQLVCHMQAVRSTLGAPWILR